MQDGPGVPRGGSGADASREMRTAARIAGLKNFETPTLEQVERRRTELLILVFLVLIALAGSLALLATAGVDGPQPFEDFGGAGAAVRIGLVVLSAAFAAYVWEKERSLRRLSRSLINERVLSAALSNRLKEISSLSEAGKAVVSSLELDDVLRVILNASFDLLEADEGSILFLEDDQLVVAAATGHAASFIGASRGLDDGLAGYVARNRDALLIEGRPDLEEFGRRLDPRETEIAAAILVPLEAKGELLGVLNLNVLEGERRFNEYDLRALTLFGEHAAMAIRHSRIIRKERELRSRMAELDRVRAELVGSMTHDLKTPLTTILGSAKLLLRRADEMEGEQRRELLEAVERQSQRLLLLIERLLDAARSQAEYSLSCGPLDLGPQVERLVASFASAHDREILVNREPGTVEVFADPDGVEQILANLLDNALKYTPQDTAIRVGLACRDGRVDITVADDGPGIPPEVQATLFEPFRRGATPSPGGVGLGLFIVVNLARAMGGGASVESAPGRGAVFTVTLPAQRPETAAEGESAER